MVRIYSFVDKNMTRTSNGISDEYDIVMINGKDVAIIEVKYKGSFPSATMYNS